jgi:catechol 2,3-dioxygenase-like lactoylglutathione lyase family enzyme
MSGKRALGLVALLVRDYDEALTFYVDVLGFDVVEDTPVPAQGKRWVVVSPGSGGAHVLLARAASEEQLDRVGSQAGGRVFLFLYTDDCRGDQPQLALTLPFAGPSASSSVLRRSTART